MRLNPDNAGDSLSPFTKVNGNLKITIHLSSVLFPSALAAGSDK